MSGLRRIVVTGATGKQGGALIKALLEKSPQPFEIYAVTRNTTSGGAKALASKGVKLVQGDFDGPEQIFKQVEKPWGLFSVTMPLGGESGSHGAQC
jgi:nucleoside-diphosphate-sugar epimerase